MDAKHTISTVRLDDILYPKLSQLDNRTDTMTDMSDDFTKNTYMAVPFEITRNRAGYEALLDQNVHPNFRDFRKLFPLKSDRQAKAMERVLSCLAFWSPIFANLDYLPAMVFPFVTLFSNDLFSGFEVYAWTMMQSLFSEVFSRPDWLKLWDHLLTQPPSFMYHFVIAYITTFRVSLLDITELADFKFFFQRQFIVNYQSQMKEKIDQMRPSISENANQHYEQHIANISRAIGHTSRAKSHQHEQKDLEVAFGVSRMNG
ncbi:hypothetical protein BASA61_007141 [Batrachochytrium salamandrivorans]|nr:hypothetical protein BASA61_007141 [Batrachochytrium salamandrivorans]